jgi:hypothetical protein
VRKGVTVAISILAVLKANFLYSEKRNSILKYHFSNLENTLMHLERKDF